MKFTKNFLLCLLIIITLSGVASAELSNELISYWKFDETNGTNVVDSLNFRNLTASSNVLDGSDGIINASGNFTTRTNYARSSETYNIGTNDFTVSSWVKVIGAQSRLSQFWNFDYSKTNSLIFGSGDASDDFQMVVRKGTANTVINVNSIPVNEWVHLVLVRTGTTIKIFKNRVEVYSDSNSAFDVSLNQVFETGYASTRAHATSGGKGLIDEVGIWNRTLNSTEITELYNIGNNGTYPFVSDAPVILNNSWNLSSAISIENSTGWRGGNEHVPLRTFDTTPTIRFSTDIKSSCRITSNSAHTNYSLMGASRDCSTTGSTDHVCTVIGGDALVRGTYDQVWVSCLNVIVNNESLSSALNMTVLHHSNIISDIYKSVIGDVTDYTIDEYDNFIVFSNWTFDINDSVITNSSGSCDYELEGNYYSLFYDGTEELWIGNTSHFYNSSQLGLNNISVNCSGTFLLQEDSITVNVTQADMIINLSSIWDYHNGNQSFVNGVSANYPLLSTINFSGSCFSYHLANYTFTIFYYNSSVLYSNTFVSSPNSSVLDVNLNNSYFSNSSLYLDGSLDYLARFTCTDSFGVSTVQNKNFYVVDDLPVVSWLNSSPLFANSMPVILNWSVTDEKIFSPNCSLFVNDVLNATSLVSGVLINFSEGIYDLKVSCYDGIRSSVNASLLLTYTATCIIEVDGLSSGERYNGLLQNVNLSCFNPVNLSSCSYRINNYASVTPSDCSNFNVTLLRGKNDIEFSASVLGVESLFSIIVWAFDPDSNVFSYVLIWVYIGIILVLILFAGLSGMGVFWIISGVIGVLLGFEISAISYYGGLLIGILLFIACFMVFLFKK